MGEETRSGNKADLIIKTAQNLFGIYGFEKVSMSEISDELKLSKASLYYYFPDKMELYKAVLVKEQEEFLQTISEITGRIKIPDKMLEEYARQRLYYFRRLLNLSRLRLDVYSSLKPEIKDLMRSFYEKEKEIVMGICENGRAAGIFNLSDAGQTASLFLDLLRGLRTSVISSKLTLMIDEHEYEMLFQKTISFTEIFIKGLKYSDNSKSIKND
jgi:TetR/AcrR family transcriptional repressor of mexJK operon